MMTTLEYATIRKCLSQLKSELSLDLSIADDLLADDFISEPASKKMRLIGVDDHTKAGELIDNILHQIKMKQERYHEFITILRKEPSRESMVELLEKTYEEGTLTASFIAKASIFPPQKNNIENIHTDHPALAMMPLRVSNCNQQLASKFQPCT